MQNDLGLIQLHLRPRDRIRLTRLQIPRHIITQRGPLDRILCTRRPRDHHVRGLGVGFLEVVDDLGVETVGDHTRVLGVGDDDAADADGGAVGVAVGALFFHFLSRPWGGALGDGLGEEGHCLAGPGGTVSAWDAWWKGEGGFTYVPRVKREKESRWNWVESSMVLVLGSVEASFRRRICGQLSAVGSGRLYRYVPTPM
jgi:hypothetical protein